MVQFLETQKDGKIRQNRKEDHFYSEYAALIPDTNNPTQSNAIVTLRLYATKTRVYCCLWAHSPDWSISLSGGDYAGGYGYHKPSSAAQGAFKDAGIVLPEYIAGRGDQAIEEAVCAVAKALTDKPFIIHKSHA